MTSATWQVYGDTPSFEILIEAKGQSPADAFRMALCHLEDFAGSVRDGGKSKAVFRAWTRDDEMNKLAERRDRWRQRAETAGELAATMLAQRDEARAEIESWKVECHGLRVQRKNALRERDVARAEADRLRAELKQARTIRVTEPTPGVEPINAADRIADVPTWRGRPIGEVPDPTPTLGSEVERLRRDLLGVVETIRDDLRRSREVRR